MFSIDPRRAAATVAVMAGLLAAAAGPAAAANSVVTDNKDPDTVYMADMGGQYATHAARPAPDAIIAVLIGL